MTVDEWHQQSRVVSGVILKIAILNDDPVAGDPGQPSLDRDPLATVPCVLTGGRPGRAPVEEVSTQGADAVTSMLRAADVFNHRSEPLAPSTCTHPLLATAATTCSSVRSENSAGLTICRRAYFRRTPPARRPRVAPSPAWLSCAWVSSRGAEPLRGGCTSYRTDTADASAHGRRLDLESL
jgi:hypothetical protein